LEKYRGRVAPSPTGYLHLGHARTFLIAAERARHFNGDLILRNEDLDPDRCRPEFVSAMYEDLRWLGISWSEDPDCGGACAPYSQSQRREFYLAAWEKLRNAGAIYPCTFRGKIWQSLPALPTIWTMSPSIREIVVIEMMGALLKNQLESIGDFECRRVRRSRLTISISDGRGMLRAETLEILWFGEETMFRLTNLRWL
jgi:hypothetical protein